MLKGAERGADGLSEVRDKRPTDDRAHHTAMFVMLAVQSMALLAFIPLLVTRSVEDSMDCEQSIKDLDERFTTILAEDQARQSAALQNLTEYIVLSSTIIHSGPNVYADA